MSRNTLNAATVGKNRQCDSLSVCLHDTWKKQIIAQIQL